jgi:hypothetical protein
MLFWSDGDVKYFNGSSLRDMGYFECKEQIQAWCAEKGVKFIEHLPVDPRTFVWSPPKLRPLPKHLRPLD